MTTASADVNRQTAEYLKRHPTVVGVIGSVSAGAFYAIGRPGVPRSRHWAFKLVNGLSWVLRALSIVGTPVTGVISNTTGITTDVLNRRVRDQVSGRLARFSLITLINLGSWALTRTLRRLALQQPSLQAIEDRGVIKQAQLAEAKQTPPTSPRLQLKVVAVN